MKCPACRGKGCPRCDQQGRIRITSCPREFVTDDVWELFQAMDLADHGSWPVAGGWLDQTKTLVDGVSMARVEKSHYVKD